ncbi:MAG TPA: hypothetical protein VHR36_15340 [Pyrinomonadaceae bacterium]|jgi:hypothetical protein|nr:hypothetical protein [Pyrinomonadaceae bacterium]
MIPKIARVFFVFGFITILGCVAAAQQVPDPNFNPHIEHPAYTKNFPRVLFDEAHNNFHTATGRYKPFVDMMFSDGYQISANRKPFSKESLQTYKILIIANALGAEEMDDEGADKPAFTEAECDVVREWVSNGGALLLIADHAPFGAAAQILAKRFDVEMSKGYVFDREHSVADNPTLLIFSRENKLLLDHPITEGRNDSERISRVQSFTGQALKGPQGAAQLLVLAATATDQAGAMGGERKSVAGQAQAIAFKLGKGRVVMLGEAAMLSAQVAGPDNFKMGMNVPGNDDRQFALNIMHWLSGLLR